MPKLPEYDSPQTETRALPNVRQSSMASPELFGASATQQLKSGQQITQVGYELSKVAASMQERENVDMLFRAETALKDEYIEFQKTARERRGQDAWGLAKDTADWWEKSTSKHMDNLQNPAQRQMLEKSATRLRQSSVDGAAAYESEQRRQSIESSANASITSSINMAAANAQRWKEKRGEDEAPDPVTAAKGEVLARVQALAKLNGWDEKRRTAEEQKQLTMLHNQVIQNLADNNPAKAKAYYSANKAEINGAEHDGIDRLLKTGTTKAVANSFADAVIADSMNEADALALARKHMEGDELTAAVAEVKTRFNERVQYRERAQATAADEAYGIFARTKSLASIPASVLERMDGKVRLALEHDAKLAAENKVPKSDGNRYYELRTMAADPATREAFLKHDLRKDYPSLDKQERESLLDLRDKLSKPDTAKDVETFQAQLSNYHDQMGWGMSIADRKKKGQFDIVASDAVRAEEKAKGKKLNDAERKVILDRLIIDGKGWGTGQYYEVVGTPGEKNFVPVIPKGERTKITEAIQRSGQPVTDAEVMRLYKLKMGLQ